MDLEGNYLLGYWARKHGLSFMGLAGEPLGLRAQTELNCYCVVIPKSYTIIDIIKISIYLDGRKVY